MRQTTLSVTLEVQPESAGRLASLIDDLRKSEEAPNSAYPDQYGRLTSKVPALHFMSISVFPSAEYDPLFVIEANFDGEPGRFFAQIEAALGSELRPMLRCCKRPSDSSGEIYDEVTTGGPRYSIAQYLEARTIRPSVFHHGNRGLDRDRILEEGKLFRATRVELAKSDPSRPNPYRAMSAEQIHAGLRTALQRDFPWLNKPAPARIPPAERAADLLRLGAFVFVLLACLSIPGGMLALLARTPAFLVITAVSAALVYVFLYRMRAPLPGKGAPMPSGGLTPASLSMKNEFSSFANPVTLVVVVLAVLALYVALATLVGAAVMVPLSGFPYKVLLWPTFRIVGLGLVSAIVFVLPAIVLWLRWLERRDSSHDAPSVDPDLLRAMAQREDRIAQNHMGSIVLVKPGVLRMALFRAGHLALGLILRVIATDGYLGSMRTIHFAHWAFVNNGSRLMFFSNFDHSWESYLDDFIEKAHGGLTLAWSSGVGFPPARFLVLDGASHGRKFKAWARHSMAVSRFWYSAYKSYTADQIERHARIADGLRKAKLTEKEAAAWVRDL
jgi:membrane protein implicated in regulation of membrane protease activity